MKRLQLNTNTIMQQGWCCRHESLTTTIKKWAHTGLNLDGGTAIISIKNISIEFKVHSSVAKEPRNTALSKGPLFWKTCCTWFWTSIGLTYFWESNFLGSSSFSFSSCSSLSASWSFSPGIQYELLSQVSHCLSLNKIYKKWKQNAW